MKPQFIIFSGYNERAVFAFLRHLSINDISYAIIAADKNDRIFLTKYGKAVRYIRHNASLNFTEILEALRHVCASKQNRYFYAPTTESLNRIMLSNKDEIERLGITIPLITLNTYSLLSDKYQFYNLCKSNHINVPKEIHDPRYAQLPFVAKPKNYGQGSYLKPVLILNEQERKLQLQSKQEDNFFYQEFVSGRSIYYLLYLGLDGGVTAFSQENYIQQPHGKSIIAAIATDHWKSKNCTQYITLLCNIKFRGLVMIEVCQTGDMSYMIEANPRFWGPSQLFVDSMSENLFSKFIQDWCAAKTKSHTRSSHGRYYWHEGLIETIRNGEKPVFHNYTEEKFVEDLPKWLEADIYRRSDIL